MAGYAVVQRFSWPKGGVGKREMMAVAEQERTRGLWDAYKYDDLIFCSCCNIWPAYTKNYNSDHWCLPRWLNNKLQFLWWVNWWTRLPRDLLTLFFDQILRLNGNQEEKPRFQILQLQRWSIDPHHRNSYSLEQKRLLQMSFGRV